MLKDPRYIYSGVTKSRVDYFGWTENGSIRMLHKSKITFIPGNPYIVSACEKEGYVTVSGLFKFGEKTIYHTQKILKKVCKQALEFERIYPKTSKR